MFWMQGPDWSMWKMFVAPVFARIPTYFVVRLLITSLSPPDAVRFPSLNVVASVAGDSGLIVFLSVIRVMQSFDGLRVEYAVELYGLDFENNAFRFPTVDVLVEEQA
jgi:hypothetical protein